MLDKIQEFLCERAHAEQIHCECPKRKKQIKKKCEKTRAPHTRTHTLTQKFQAHKQTEKATKATTPTTYVNGQFVYNRKKRWINCNDARTQYGHRYKGMATIRAPIADKIIDCIGLPKLQ